MYVITGATGHTGSVAAENLLETGAKVRVIGRDAKRLERFVQKGAEAFVANVADASAMTKAFSGARAVYVMIPPNPSAPDVRGYQEQVADALSTAIRGAGVAQAVALSSIGADKPSGTGPVVGLHKFESKLNAIEGLNVVSLRAGYFMENLLAQVPLIRALGFSATPLRADLPLAMIAARDIGAAAAQLLAKLDFSGKQAMELQGAGDVTYMEATKTIGAAIGRPDLIYRQVAGTQIRSSLMQMGMSASMADGILEMCDALNSGYMKALEPRSAKNTTTTTVGAFASEVFAPAYRGAAATAS